MTNKVRTEQDFLGEVQIPADVYWGVHTFRALSNFPISGQKISLMKELVDALAIVKKSCAQANFELNVLNAQQVKAISTACDKIISGQYHDQFVVDVIQGGAGTSTNMNANEVVANVALEVLGHNKGEYQYLHPNDHVNASQSTNDVYPTALKVALWNALEVLTQEANKLKQSFDVKAKEFAKVLKIGRTQLQDAVPMTLGQEFSTFAQMVEKGILEVGKNSQALVTVNLGGTAIGTGINAPPGFSELACKYLAQYSSIPISKSDNMISATQDTGPFVLLSSALKYLAVYLSKISNDLRLLSSGPQAGISDIFLPARQAGSSIMPGKVNPVIPEVVNQVAFNVIGKDVTVNMAAEAGQLQLNAFEPVIVYSLYESIKQLANACYTLRVNCVDGIRANEKLLQNRIKHSVTLVTALNPIIGYENAAKIAKQALANDTAIDETAQQLGILTKQEVDDLLVAEKLTQPVLLKK